MWLCIKVSIFKDYKHISLSLSSKAWTSQRLTTALKECKMSMCSAASLEDGGYVLELWVLVFMTSGVLHYHHRTCLIPIMNCKHKECFNCSMHLLQAVHFICEPSLNCNWGLNQIEKSSSFLATWLVKHINLISETIAVGFSPLTK